MNDNNNEKKMESKLASWKDLHFCNYVISVCEIQPANNSHIHSITCGPLVGVCLFDMSSPLHNYQIMQFTLNKQFTVTYMSGVMANTRSQE